MSYFNMFNCNSYMGGGQFIGDLFCSPYSFGGVPQFNSCNNINSCFAYPMAGAYYGSNLGVYMTPNMFPYGNMGGSLWQTNPMNYGFNYSQPFQFNMNFTNPFQFNSNFTNPFNFNNNSSKVNNNNSAKTNNTTKVDNDSNSALTGKKDLAYWKSQGYDEVMGQKLAKDAVATCAYKWNGQCVGYTRKTINRIYGTTFSNAGAAQNFGHKILDSKELKGKFKCFKINGIKPEDIPDGAILIWPGSAFGKGKAAQYGHGAIAYKGKPYSDNVGCNTMKCNEIWIPVKS